jgi:hypothetical protein
MFRLILLLNLAFIFASANTFSQGFQISPPRLDFDGRQLLISYDVINKKEGDQFFVWVEIEKKNGEKIMIKALTGDVGDKIKVGMNKKIYWTPERDSVFLDEDVSVEVKAEKYTKTFNKSSMVLMSTVMPGLGQTKISKGKPWWITGVLAYGTLAGGFINYQNYVSSYDSYNKETDGAKRGEFLAQAQKQKNLSTALIATGATLWIGNLIWVSVIPNKYQPLKNNIKLSLEKAPGSNNGTALLSMHITF